MLSITTRAGQFYPEFIGSYIEILSFYKTARLSKSAFFDFTHAASFGGVDLEEMGEVCSGTSGPHSRQNQHAPAALHHELAAETQLCLVLFVLA